MAQFLHTASLPFGAITLHKIGRSIDDVIEQIRAEIRAQRTAAALRRLSRSQLEDIGLTEADIEIYARTGRW